jgi:hypothetical protein
MRCIRSFGSGKRGGLRTVRISDMIKVGIDVAAMISQPFRLGELGLDQRVVFSVAAGQIEQPKCGPVAACFTEPIRHEPAVPADCEARQ